MTMVRLMILAGLALLPAAGWAAMPGRADPDWPCQQIKVPDLSLGAVWNGAPLSLRSWSQDTEVAALAQRLAQRRIPIEQAQSEIAAFAQRAGAGRAQRLPLLMDGLFDTLDQERASVLAGLDRYGRRQRTFADEIRADNAALRGLQSQPGTDPAKLAQAVDQLTLELRVFEDRRASLRFACNVPTTIEQRLYSLAQAIQQAMR